MAQRGKSKLEVKAWLTLGILLFDLAGVAHAQFDEPELDEDAPEEAAPDDEGLDAEPDEPDLEEQELEEDDTLEAEAADEAPHTETVPDPRGDPEMDAPVPTPETAAAEEDPDLPADEEEIVVTGSRIKRSVFAASAPVDVLSRKDLEFSGATNMQDVVQHLAVQQGSGFRGGGEANLQGGGAGTTYINLRGLGGGATLVLVNGRRVSPSAAGLGGVQFVDISTIPLAMVERIEILKGGASAIYGSDAVAGVVNIITRQDWEGFRIEADAQTTDNLDYEEATASVAFGASGERARTSLGLQYYRQGSLLASERDFTREGAHISTTGYPGAFYPASPSAGFLGVPVADPNCGLAPHSAVATRTDPVTGAVSEYCTFDFNNYRGLIGNLERVNAYGYAEYDLTRHTRAFGELMVSRTRSDNVSSPSLPWPPPFALVPGNHVDNPTNSLQGFLGRPLGAEFGAQTTQADDDTLRAGLGLKGDFEGVGANTVFEDWEWELFATWGISRYRLVIPDTLREEFQQALDSCSDLSDLTECYNPYYSAELGTGTPNPSSVIDEFNGTQVTLTDHGMQTVNAGLAGGLFELPGGDLGFALGGEVRREFRATDLDHDSNQQRYTFLVGNTDRRTSREVYGAYLEFLWPFYDGIELQTAGRLERYTDTEITAASPTVGLTLVPSQMAGGNIAGAFEKLQLRGHVTRAFRAPTLFNTDPGFEVVPQLFTQFPRSEAPAGVFLPVQNFGNPDLDVERATAISGGFQWQPISWLSLVFDYWQYDYQDRIDRENATQALATYLGTGSDRHIVLSEGCNGPASQCIERIEVTTVNTGDLFTNGIDATVMFSFDGADFGGSEGDFGTISFGATGTYTLAYEIPQEAIAPLSTPEGDILHADEQGNPVPVSPTEETTLPLFLPEGCDGEMCDVSGRVNTTVFAGSVPKLRANFPVTWTFSDHMASVVVHYLDSVENDARATPQGGYEVLDAMVMVDLQYGYTLRDVIGSATTLRLGVINVFEELPPVTPNDLDGLSSLHDPRGRMFYAKLIQEF